MIGRVLILGGYGNFGKRIAGALTAAGIGVVVAGRNRTKAEALAGRLPTGLAEPAWFDISRDLDAWLKEIRPAVVVHACGPFQGQDYGVARACIANGAHYVDLSDGRGFVTGITALDQDAKEAGVAVISGASTIPGLSSAVLEHFQGQFSRIDSLRYGISPGQKAERGLATTQGVLSYVGRPLTPFAGSGGTVYGWQDIYRQAYPGLGKRWMANCDVPDLDLFAERYGVGSIRFSAGLEVGLLHLGLWGLSWLVRWGLPLNLPRHAGVFLRASNWFNGLGTADGGMHVVLSGLDLDGRPVTRSWYIIAREGDGPFIPTVPAILLARRLASGEAMLTGAYPCVGLVTLDDYLDALGGHRIETLSL